MSNTTFISYHKCLVFVYDTSMG